MRVYSVKDQKAEFFMSPFIQRNKGEAIRGLEQAGKDPKSLIHSSPVDFDLFELGEWDDTTGSIVPHESPEHVINAKDIQTLQ
jgi:hypothetical protein